MYILSICCISITRNDLASLALSPSTPDSDPLTLYSKYLFNAKCYTVEKFTIGGVASSITCAVYSGTSLADPQRYGHPPYNGRIYLAPIAIPI